MLVRAGRRRESGADHVEQHGGASMRAREHGAPEARRAQRRSMRSRRSVAFSPHEFSHRSAQDALRWRASTYRRPHKICRIHIKMSQLWTARVTPRESHDDLATLRRVLSGLGGAYVVVREYGDDGTNLHYHACFYTEVKQPRQKFVYAFESAGNAVYSVKKCDEGMLRYIMKGDAKHPEPRGAPPDIVVSHGLAFTEEKIKALHDAYWSQSDKVKASKDLSWPKKIEHYMVTNAMEFTWENCVDATVDMYLAHKCALDKYQVIKVAQHIMATKNNGFRQAFKDECRRSGQIIF